MPNTSGNVRFYMGAWLAVRVTYIHGIMEMALKKLSTPSKQQWQNFLILLKHSFPLQTSDHEDEDEDIPTADSGPKRTLTTAPGSSKRRCPGGASSAPATSSTPASSKAKRKRKHNPHPYLDTLNLRHGKVQRLVWADKEILLTDRESLNRGLTPDISCEVLWELHMMGFNLELLAADQFMAPHLWPKDPESESALKRLKCEQVLRRVFPKKGDGVGEFFISEIPNRDGGLASHRWEERAPHVLAFREVLLEWSNCPASVSSAPAVQSEVGLVKLERDLVKFYCSSFASTFSRLPIPPVRLPFVSRMRAAPASLVGTIEGL
jgi:hypothetical protein